MNMNRLIIYYYSIVQLFHQVFDYYHKEAKESCSIVCKTIYILSFLTPVTMTFEDHFRFRTTTELPFNLNVTASVPPKDIVM